MVLKDGDAEEWKRRAWSFGEAMKDQIWFLETVDTKVDIANYPRTLYQGSLEGRRHRPKHERQERQADAAEAVQVNGVEVEEGEREVGGQQEQERQDGGVRNEQLQQEAINAEQRQFPEGPRARRPNPDDKAYGGWDVIDHLTVD